LTHFNRDDAKFVGSYNLNKNLAHAAAANYVTFTNFVNAKYVITSSGKLEATGTPHKDPLPKVTVHLLLQIQIPELYLFLMTIAYNT